MAKPIPMGKKSLGKRRGKQKRRVKGLKKKRLGRAGHNPKEYNICGD